jgi:hypothetical protein
MLDYTEKFDMTAAFDGCLKQFSESNTDAARVCTVQNGGNINMVLVVRGTKPTEEMLKAVEAVMNRWEKTKVRAA